MGQATQKTIEDSARTDFERNKLIQKNRELETQFNLTKDELDETNSRCKTLIMDKQRLVEQISIFDKDSFEIQARVKQGMESERDVETL